MFRSSSASGISDSSSGAVLLSTSLECLTHRAFGSFSDVRSCPCVSRMGTFLLPLYFPQTSLVIFFDISPLIGSNLPLVTPIDLCLLHRVSLLSAVIYLLLKPAPALDI